MASSTVPLNRKFSMGLAFVFFCFFFSNGSVAEEAAATKLPDPAEGFTEVALNPRINFELHKPFDLPWWSRYLFDGDLHKFWVLKTDNPAWNHPGSPRSEIRMRGHEYTSGTWQFEGYGYVPEGTSGVCIMQVFGPKDGHPTIFMLKVYNGNLCYFNSKNVLARNIYNRWFKLNVIHNADAGIMQIFLDGQMIQHLKNRRMGAQYWFQFGVYAQDNYSDYMEARWEGVKVYKMN